MAAALCYYKTTSKAPSWASKESKILSYKSNVIQSAFAHVELLLKIPII